MWYRQPVPILAYKLVGMEVVFVSDSGHRRLRSDVIDAMLAASPLRP